MTTINQLPLITNPTQNDLVIGYASNDALTGKMTLAQLADVLTSISASAVITSAAISAGGGVLDGFFAGAKGYAKRTGVQTYTAVSTIPASDVTGLGTLATTSTATSGITFLGLGALATTSTAASARSFIGFSSIGTAIAINASTAASVRSQLGLGGLSTVAASVGTPSDNMYLKYKNSDSQWVASSIAFTPSFKGGKILYDATPTKTNVGIEVTLAAGSISGDVGTTDSWNSTTGRYTPSTAGKYLVNFSFNAVPDTSPTSCVAMIATIKKNGVATDGQTTLIYPTKDRGSYATGNTSTILSCNGSTDYICTTFMPADTTASWFGNSLLITYLGA